MQVGLLYPRFLFFFCSAPRANFVVVKETLRFFERYKHSNPLGSCLGWNIRFFLSWCLQYIYREKKRLSGLYVFVSSQEQKYILQESNVASFCLWNIKKQKPVNFNLLLLGNVVNCTSRNEQSIICVVISTEWSTEIIWQSVPSQFAIRIILLVVVVFFSVFVFRNAHSDQKLERNIGFIAEVLVRHIFNLTTKVSCAYVFDRKKYWSTNLSSK